MSIEAKQGGVSLKRHDARRAASFRFETHIKDRPDILRPLPGGSPVKLHPDQDPREMVDVTGLVSPYALKSGHNPAKGIPRSHRYTKTHMPDNAPMASQQCGTGLTEMSDDK